jgi:formate dehydrogenase subunit gamma
MILAWILFVISGVIMWFGKGVVSADLFRWMVLVHDLTMIAAVCMFLVHLYLAVAHPLMWAALVSMRFGFTSAAYAAEHHAKWYYGPKRAKELYEAKKKIVSAEG